MWPLINTVSYTSIKKILPTAEKPQPCHVATKPVASSNWIRTDDTMKKYIHHIPSIQCLMLIHGAIVLSLEIIWKHFFVLLCIACKMLDVDSVPCDGANVLLLFTSLSCCNSLSQTNRHLQGFCK